MTNHHLHYILTISNILIYFSKACDNMIYDYLMENYKQGEPIFSADIHIHEMSEENIRYHLKKLTDDGVKIMPQFFISSSADLSISFRQSRN